jgi:hypothetical protein
MIHNVESHAPGLPRRGAGHPRDYMARHMYEDVGMNADEFTRYLRAQQPEYLQFLTEMGLALKKQGVTARLRAGRFCGRASIPPSAPC